MNRLTTLFQNKNKEVLSIYFTAGYPALNDTVTIIKTLEEAGVDFLEIGMPFSDPVADGPTIQASSEVALENGMTVKLLFEQLKDIRKDVKIPLLLMGYINPVLQYGLENFCKKCAEIGIDGVILPDLPMQEYLDIYKKTFDQYGISNIFLITPVSSDERVRWIDQNSNGFIYLVASASVTGTKNGVSDEQEVYFERIQKLNLKNPRVIGFGINDNKSFLQASKYANGAIIGSAFVKAITGSKDLKGDIKKFISLVRGK